MNKGYRANEINFDAPFEQLQTSLKANFEERTVGGFALVINANNQVIGTLTDGDIRKFSLNRGFKNNLSAQDVMNSNFVRVSSNTSPIQMATQIVDQLSKRPIRNEFPITYIPVLDFLGKQESLIHISHLSPYLDEITRQIVIVGQGFVGITLAMAMVNKGMKVVAVENNPEQFEKIINLMPKVHEPQLHEILKNNIEKNYIIKNKSLLEIERSPLFGRRIVIVCVGTPRVNGEIILTQLYDSCKEIAKSLQQGDIVIIRSTVPVGTSRDIARVIESTSEMRVGVDFHLIYAPERTVEGNAINEVVKLPQLVAGITDNCAKVAVTFFSPWVANVIRMENLEACELAKLSSNAYRDVTFAFANEIARIASQFDIDINKMIANANSGYSRNSIPNPSPGVGGPCLTKDSYMLSKSSELSVIGAGRKVNESMIKFCVDKIFDMSQRYGKHVLVIGLAFKGNPPTNDIRHSSSVEIVRELQEKGLRISNIDAVAQPAELESSKLHPYTDQETDIRLYCLLNNHLENQTILHEILKKQKKLLKSQEIAIFDPWNCVDVGDIPGDFNLEISSLSKTWRIQK
jgi:nucleotide sugar dehydrogenase